MSRGKELVKNTAILAIGQACTKCLSFFLLPFYTAVLSTADYGIVDLFGTYASLLVPIIVFQIMDALFRFTIDVRENEEAKKKVISTTMYFCLAQSVVFSLIFFVVQSFVEIPYKQYLWLSILVSIFSGPLFQFARGIGDNFAYACGNFLSAIISILLNIVTILVFDMGAEGLFITNLSSSIAGMVYIIFKERVYRLIRIRCFDIKLLKDMLEYSLPLVPNYLSWWVIGASDKTVVNWFLGVSQNGILSVSQRFSTMYTTFYSIFNTAWTEHAAVHCDDQDSEEYYSQTIETSFRILASACLGIIAVVAIIFPWLINENFKEAYYQIPIYMLSSLLYSAIGIYSVVYIAHKKTGGIAKTSVIAAVINLGINVGLIRYIGLYAASVSSVVAYGVLFLIRYFDIRKFMKIRIKKSVVISVVIFMIIDFIVYYTRDTRLSIVNLLVIIVYVAYLNRKIFLEMLGMIKEKMKR